MTPLVFDLMVSERQKELINSACPAEFVFIPEAEAGNRPENRPENSAENRSTDMGLKVRFTLALGDLLIRFGEKLKSRYPEEERRASAICCRGSV